MVIEKYGVRLIRMQEEHLEMVRNWRNDPKISQYMEYRDHITAEMQVAWFKKINNENNLFFIIEYQGEKVGVINMKDIDYKKREGEGGIYIYEDKGPVISFSAQFALIDYCFEQLKFNRVIFHIMTDNIRAIRFNKTLGLKLADNQDGVANQFYTMTKEDYFKSRERYIRLLR